MDTSSILNLIDFNCSEYPGRTAIDYEGTKLTYAELRRELELCSKELDLAGIGPGSRVAVAVADKTVFIKIWLACWRTGAIPIPFEPAKNLPELEKMVSTGQCHYLICDPMDPETGSRLELLLRSPIFIFKAAASFADEERDQDMALNFYTSGTTGLPKCVQFSHQAIYHNVMSICRGMEMTPSDRLFTPLSPWLPAALTTAVLPALCAGAALVMSKGTMPARIFEQIKRQEITIFFAVPYLYALLNESVVSSSSVAWDNVRLCISCSAHLDAATFNDFYKLTGKSIRSLFCSSEGGAIAYNGSNQYELIKASVGQPHPGVSVRLLDPEGHEVAAGEEGEIWVSGAHISSGYYRQPELQAEVFQQGWVRTGDLGRLDEQGFLYLSGRLSDNINVGGHLVNPTEIEQVLLLHNGIKEALVYGIADKYYGSKLIAEIVPLNARVPDDDIIKFCSARLPGHKVPRVIKWTDSIPKGRYGKKLRNQNQAVGHIPTP
ncbi:class I adenylate-forming enzyme family protein [Paenibacillus sp. CN-4]|uniref:class I adenylate-forming enzyme family protein n=1 Tax=Paenibacillus nanchangensis TaxID=3348343 RepID=UPI00397B12CE